MDIVDLSIDYTGHGDTITDQFRDVLLPQLTALSAEELFEAAGMLLYLNSSAEARACAILAGNRHNADALTRPRQPPLPATMRARARWFPDSLPTLTVTVTGGRFSPADR